MKTLLGLLLIFLAASSHAQVAPGGGGGQAGGGAQNQAGGCNYQGPEGSLNSVTHDFNGLKGTQCFGWDDKGGLLRYRDNLGNENSQSWDSLGRITSFQNPLNKAWTYSYNNLSQMSRITHIVDGGRWQGELSRVNEVGFLYDHAGNLININQGPQGAVASSRMRLSPDDTVNTMEHPGGYGTCVASRDTAGRPSAIRMDGVNPQSGGCENAIGEIRYSFDGNTGNLSSTSTDNGDTIITRDGFGRPTEIRSPDLSKITYQYNAAGLVSAWQKYGAPDVGSGNSKIVAAAEKVYDVMGRLTELRESIIAPEGVSAQGLANVANRRVTKFSYDERATGLRVTTQTAGANGPDISSVISYDTLGRITQNQSPEQPALNYTYNGLVTSVLNAGTNQQMNQTYDAAGQLKEIRSPTGATKRFDYDSRGVLTQSWRNGFIDRGFYSDDLKRVRKIGKAKGAGEDFFDEAIINYDENGNRTELVAPGNARWQWQYRSGSAKWLSTVIDPIGNALQISRYDNIGRVAEETDARGTRFVYTYDKNNRLTGIDATLAGGGNQYHRRMIYNGAGALAWAGESRGATPPSRNQRPMAKQWSDRGSPNPTEVSRDSDSLGRLLQEQATINGTTYGIQKTYTNVDTPVLVTLPSGVVVSYQYTDAGFLRRVEARGRQGGSVLWSADFVYTPATGRYERINHSDGTVTTFTYDPYARLIGWQRTGANNLLIAKEEFRLTSRGKVSARLRRLPEIQPGVAGGPNTATSIFQFGYDNLDRLVLTETITEDAFNRLQHGFSLVAQRGTRVECSRNTKRRCFLSDDRNNLTHSFAGTTVQEYSALLDDSLSQVIEHRNCTLMMLTGDSDCSQPRAVVTSIGRDSNGNLVSETAQPGGPVRSYTYDAWDRLEKVVIIGTPQIEVNYEYDGLNRLVRRRVFQQANANANYTFSGGTIFVWNGGTVMEVRQVAANGTETRQDLIYGVGNGPMASLNNEQEVNEHVRALDGSLLGIRRNNSWREWLNYDPFGQASIFEMVGNVPTDIYPRAAFTPALFRNLIRDPATGLDFVGGRWYQSWRGRYLTRDPVGVSVGQTNLFEFSGGDPITP